MNNSLNSNDIDDETASLNEQPTDDIIAARYINGFNLDFSTSMHLLNVSKDALYSSNEHLRRLLSKKKQQLRDKQNEHQRMTMKLQEAIIDYKGQIQIAQDQNDFIQGKITITIESIKHNRDYLNMLPKI